MDHGLAAPGVASPSPACSVSPPRTVQRGDSQPTRRVQWQPELHARVGHALGEQEEVSRAAARQRSDCIHLRFVVEPDPSAARVEDELRRSARRGRDAGGGEQRRRAGAHHCRAVWHRAHDRQPAAAPGIEVGAAQPGGDGNQRRALALQGAPQLADHAWHLLWFDSQHNYVRV
jgi:hypothetical protein